MDASTVPELVSATTADQPSQPLITYYDDETGERTELSGLTLANWIAKTANLLVDGCGLGAGSRVRVRLPPHWQTAAILLGCWTAGVAVEPATSADLAASVDVAFVGATKLSEAFLGPVAPDEVFALALAPLAAPIRPAPPPGILDFVVEVRPHGDRFTPFAPVTGETAALVDGTTQAELVARAADLANRTGWPAGSRLFIDGDTHPDPVEWLLAPLYAHASVVLCRHLSTDLAAERGDAERVTHQLI